MFNLLSLKYIVTEEQFSSVLFDLIVFYITTSIYRNKTDVNKMDYDKIIRIEESKSTRFDEIRHDNENHFMTIIQLQIIMVNILETN